MNEIEQTIDDRPPEHGPASGPGPTDTAEPPPAKTPLVRHATPPRTERGRGAIIAVCASLAGVVVGFVLSTAAYRDAATAQQRLVPAAYTHGAFVTPVPSMQSEPPLQPMPHPPSATDWRWHQHGDLSNEPHSHLHRHGSDEPHAHGHSHDDEHAHNHKPNDTRDHDTRHNCGKRQRGRR